MKTLETDKNKLVKLLMFLRKQLPCVNYNLPIQYSTAFADVSISLHALLPIRPPNSIPTLLYIKNTQIQQGVSCFNLRNMLDISFINRS